MGHEEGRRVHLDGLRDRPFGDGRVQIATGSPPERSVLGRRLGVGGGLVLGLRVADDWEPPGDSWRALGLPGRSFGFEVALVGPPGESREGCSRGGPLPGRVRSLSQRINLKRGSVVRREPPACGFLLLVTVHMYHGTAP